MPKKLRPQSGGAEFQMNRLSPPLEVKVSTAISTSDNVSSERNPDDFDFTHSQDEDERYQSYYPGHYNIGDSPRIGKGGGGNSV